MVDGMYIQGMGSDDFDYDNEQSTAYFSEIDSRDEKPCSKSKSKCKWWDEKAEQNCGGMNPDCKHFDPRKLK
jgi:hypothetical protein